MRGNLEEQKDRQTQRSTGNLKERKDRQTQESTGNLEERKDRQTQRSTNPNIDKEKSEETKRFTNKKSKRIYLGRKIKGLTNEMFNNQKGRLTKAI